MERCDFASVTAILRENLMDGSFDNQVGFVHTLFESCIRENGGGFDNGLLNRWLNGLAKVSPAVGQYYHDDPAHRYELEETLRNRILPRMADSAMAAGEVHALLLRDESVSDAKKAELCGQLCEVYTDYAEFLADVLVFGMVRRPFAARDIRKSNSVPSESRSLPLCVRGNRKPCSLYCTHCYDEDNLHDTTESDFHSLLRDVPDISSGEGAIRMIWNVARLNNMEDFERGVRFLFEMEETFVRNEGNVSMMMLFSMLRVVNALRSPSENHERAALERNKFEYARSIMNSLLLTGRADLSRKEKNADVESYAESPSGRGPPSGGRTTPFIYIICVYHSFRGAQDSLRSSIFGQFSVNSHSMTDSPQ